MSALDRDYVSGIDPPRPTPITTGDLLRMLALGFVWGAVTVLTFFVLSA